MLTLILKTRRGEAATGGVLKKSQNSKKNTHVVFREFCENVLRMFFFYRVHPDGYF